MNRVVIDTGDGAAWLPTIASAPARQAVDRLSTNVGVQASAWMECGSIGSGDSASAIRNAWMIVALESRK
jgi:hypothetical protein